MGGITINVIIAVVFALLVVHLLTYLHQRYNPTNSTLKRMAVLGTCLGAYSASSAAANFMTYIIP